MRLGGRVTLGVALHATVNVGFAVAALLAATAAGAPVAEASVPEPAATVWVAHRDAVMVTLPAPAPAPVALVSRDAAAVVTSPPTTRSTTTTTAPRRASTGAPSVELTVARFDRLAFCESTGDPRAVNGPYRGAFQFLLTTWHDAGGEGDPIDAPYEEQRAVAMAWARASDPAEQWPVCWPATV